MIKLNWEKLSDRIKNYLINYFLKLLKKMEPIWDAEWSKKIRTCHYCNESYGKESYFIYCPYCRHKLTLKNYGGKK